MSDECGFSDHEPFEMVEACVSYCPACGGEVEATTTPTMFKCAESGEVFYVER